MSNKHIEEWRNHIIELLHNDDSFVERIAGELIVEQTADELLKKALEESENE